MALYLGCISFLICSALELLVSLMVRHVILTVSIRCFCTVAGYFLFIWASKAQKRGVMKPLYPFIAHWYKWSAALVSLLNCRRRTSSIFWTCRFVTFSGQKKKTKLIKMRFTLDQTKNLLYSLRILFRNSEFINSRLLQLKFADKSLCLWKMSFHVVSFFLGNWLAVYCKQREKFGSLTIIKGSEKLRNIQV